MYFQYIEPTRQQADLIVPGGGENEKALEVLISHLETALT
jgi:uridine kinase